MDRNKRRWEYEKNTIISNETILVFRDLYNNKRLKRVTINADLEIIGDNAFSGCAGLTRLDITGDVIEIGKKAFFKCKKLGQIYITTDAIEKVGTKAFSRIKSTVKVKVPNGMQKSYSTILKKGGLPSKAKVKE